jgi:N-acetylneuraminic acid mutarotase
LLDTCFEARPPALPAFRWTLAAAADLDGGVYAIGGSDEFARNTATVWRFTGTDAGWVSVHPLGTARSALAAATGSDGKIYALGGQLGAGASAVAEVYDPGLNQWSPLPAMPTPRAWLGAAAATDGRIYAIGGQLISLSTLPDGGVAATYSASGAVEIYDPSSGLWSSGPSLPTPRAVLAVARGSDGSIYAMGGGVEGGVATAVVERLAADGGWQSVAPLSVARAGLAAAMGSDGHLYAIGGIAQGGIVVDNVDVYDFASGTWSAGGGLPTARYGLAAATATMPNGYLFTMGGAVAGPLSAVLSTVEVLAFVEGYTQWQ